MSAVLEKAGRPIANAVRGRAADPLAGLQRRLVLLDADTKLSAAEREQLRHAGRALRLAADRLEEALDANRAAQALEALQLAQDAGQVCAGLSARIGR